MQQPSSEFYFSVSIAYALLFYSASQKNFLVVLPVVVSTSTSGIGSPLPGLYEDDDRD